MWHIVFSAACSALACLVQASMEDNHLQDNNNASASNEQGNYMDPCKAGKWTTLRLIFQFIYLFVYDMYPEYDQ